MSAENKPTTGKYCEKRYKCKECGHEKMIGTNHFGECYSLGNYNACPQCPPFKRPTTWVCAEPLPEGMGTPEPWKMVKLGDIAEIVKGKIKP
jgi:hypothetical protein